MTVQGLKIKNSPQFHFRFDSCHDVHIDSLSIKSPAGSPNTDGIHIENSNDVKIYNSVISNGKSSRSTYEFSHHFINLCYAYCRVMLIYLSSHVGDDCVSIGAGSYNVDIRNITCGPSHGIRYIH